MLHTSARPVHGLSLYLRILSIQIQEGTWGCMYIIQILALTRVHKSTVPVVVCAIIIETLPVQVLYCIPAQISKTATFQSIGNLEICVPTTNKNMSIPRLCAADLRFSPQLWPSFKDGPRLLFYIMRTSHHQTFGSVFQMCPRQLCTEPFRG